MRVYVLFLAPYLKRAGLWHSKMKIPYLVFSSWNAYHFHCRLGSVSWCCVPCCQNRSGCSKPCSEFFEIWNTSPAFLSCAVR